MSFPLINAILTKIEASGIEEYDGTETPTVVWTGRVKAYVREELREVASGGSKLDVVRVTTIVVPANVGRLVNTDHRVTFEYSGGTIVRRVRSRTWVPQLNRSRIGLEEE